MSGLLSLLLVSLIASSPLPYPKGQVIVMFSPEVRGQLEQALSEEFWGLSVTRKGNTTGIPSVDGLLTDAVGTVEFERVIHGYISEDAKPYGLDLIYLIRYSGDLDPQVLAQQLQALPEITFASPNYMYPVDETYPNDPLFGPDYWTQQWWLYQIDAPKAWDITTGDPTVAVAGIDTGVDWDHPDIEPNLWINGPEDINGNGTFEPWSSASGGDLDNIDNDGNGYIDDVIGWDFVSNDYDPSPFEQGNDHGTHVFGIMTMATNNGLGGASIGWRVRGMAHKCGDNQFVYTNAAINAIYYSANKGAAALNMSWGGFTYNSAVANAVAFAHEQRNVVNCGAAGNDNLSAPHYPAAYPYVLAVAATGQGDVKADFSNYGTWVDIAAPGMNILSTIPGGSYSAFDGTSMASPIVAGFAGLLRALHPTWSASQIDSAILWGADNIDEINPDYAGLLGRGRLNAFKSLALTLYAHITVVEVLVDDASGNANGRAEPGETVHLRPVVQNAPHWQDATNLSFVLRSDDPDVTIIDSTAALSSLPGGAQDTLSTDDFLVAFAGDPRYVQFTLQITATPQTYPEADTFSLIVGFPALLIVDDDGGDTLESWYIEAVTGAGINAYEHWDIATQGVPDLVNTNRSVVVWFTGSDSTEVLTPDEIAALEAFLNAGGNLFISSQYLAEDPDAAAFLNDYLHAGVQQQGGIIRRMARGYDGDPIADSVVVKLYGGDGANNNYSTDVLVALAGADSAMHYTLPTGMGNLGVAGVRYEGSYKAFYVSFPFEAIDNTASGRTTREELMARILSWCGLVDVAESTEAAPRVPQLQLLGNFLVNDQSLMLSLALPHRGTVAFSLYDASGKRVWEIPGHLYSAGIHRITLPLGSLPSGIYFLRAEGALRGVRKFLILR